MNREKGLIKLVITGDFYPGSIVNSIHNIEVAVSDEFRQILAESDLNITNLEFPLTLNESKISKSGPHLKARPNAVNLLKELGFNAVTLANNHIMDYGKAGLDDTIRTLNKHSISFAGAGTNLEEAKRPLTSLISEKRIAILNFTAHEFSIASDQKAGANPIDIIENYYQIKSAKEASDYLVIIVHSGIEHYEYPTPSMQKLCRFYASLGADAIACHHSHCISGYELFNGVPIFYGLGNFLFVEEEQKQLSHEGLALRLSFAEKAKVQFMTNKFRQILQNETFRIELVNSDLPVEFTSDVVNLKWKEHISAGFKRRNVLNHLQRKSTVKRALNRIIPQWALSGIDRAYLNLLRNESNYEYIIDVLENLLKED
jgi:hypothetical protein